MIPVPMAVRGCRLRGLVSATLSLLVSLQAADVVPAIDVPCSSGAAPTSCCCSDGAGAEATDACGACDSGAGARVPSVRIHACSCDVRPPAPTPPGRATVDAGNPLTSSPAGAGVVLAPIPADATLSTRIPLLEPGASARALRERSRVLRI